MVGLDELGETPNASIHVGKGLFEGCVGTRTDRVPDRPVDVGDFV
jgi:hypothetical protein